MLPVAQIILICAVSKMIAQELAAAPVGGYSRAQRWPGPVTEGDPTSGLACSRIPAEYLCLAAV